MKVSLVLNPLLLSAIWTIESWQSPQDDRERDAADPETKREALPKPSKPGDIIAKLEETIIPVIDFADTSVEETNRCFPPENRTLKTSKLPIQ